MKTATLDRPLVHAAAYFALGSGSALVTLVILRNQPVMQVDTLVLSCSAGAGPAILRYVEKR